MKHQKRSNTDFDFIQRRKQGKTIPRRTPLSKEIKKSITWLMFTLVFLTVVLSIVYLMNTTQSSQKGYQLQQEQMKEEQLELHQRELINKIIEAQSFDKIDASAKVLSMIKVEKLIYLDD